MVGLESFRTELTLLTGSGENIENIKMFTSGPEQNISLGMVPDLHLVIPVLDRKVNLRYNDHQFQGSAEFGHGAD
jgi:hypothetical protein